MDYSTRQIERAIADLEGVANGEGWWPYLLRRGHAEVSSRTLWELDPGRIEDSA